jgi:hypothetical protein
MWKLTQSIWNPLDLTIGAHRSNCAAINAAKSCGHPPVGSNPTYIILAPSSDDLRHS